MVKGEVAEIVVPTLDFSVFDQGFLLAMEENLWIVSERNLLELVDLELHEADVEKEKEKSPSSERLATGTSEEILGTVYEDVFGT